ncbi:hypothetical protein [uncultured Alistipes sp.]|jgi:hypothetical protein|uniref:hypothetical protein n=1 Tax=uncultured Alistipes sp. TaxID=538949 RepID=UPI0025CBA2F1|nr:hypothetical protein [uncultured Alistipes sp.]
MTQDYIIAGIRVALPRELLFGHFGMALAPFAAKDEGIAELVLETRPELTQAEGYRELDAFDFSEIDADCRFGLDAEGYLLTMISREDGVSVRFRKAYDSAVATCDCKPEHNPSFFRYGLWTVYNIAAIARQTVAIHTSVISYNGQSVLFLGESGTGKSTHTRLWRENIPGATLLNDDSPVVRVAEGGGTDAKVTAFGSPWSGKTPCYRNVSNPIRGIVRLSQAPHNQIRRLRPIEAIGALLPSCPPSFAHDEKLYDAVCATVSAIVAQVPVYHLECLPDKAAAELSFNTIFGQ